MITEEMLCAAAARSCEIYVSYLERGYTPEAAVEPMEAAGSMALRILMGIN